MKKYKRVYDFYLKEDEIDLIKIILPEYYVDQNIGKKNVSMDYAIRFLQNELNAILNSYVNGGFSYKGFILYPFVKDMSKDNLLKIKRLKEVATLLNNNGYDFSDSLRKFKNNNTNMGINSRNFASLLSSLYRDFSLIKSKNVKSMKKFKCKELNISSYKKADTDYLRPLNDLKNYADGNLKHYLSGFYLHGSLATKDYIKGWSDVDTLSIVSKETIDSPEDLTELRNRLYNIRYFFYKIEPLQHHGSIIISEYDLDNYCQAYFPVQIFNYAKSFWDDRVNDFRVRNCSNEALEKLFWFVDYFRRLNIQKKSNLGSYDTKTLLHSITLFPAMYLQAKGILVYKKFSFDIAKKDFRKDSWKIINNVSSIRSNWKNFGIVPLISLYSKVNPLLCYQLNSRIVDLFKNINKLNNIDTINITENMHELSEEAWSKIKENAKRKRL